MPQVAFGLSMSTTFEEYRAAAFAAATASDRYPGVALPDGPTMMTTFGAAAVSAFAGGTAAGARMVAAASTTVVRNTRIRGLRRSPRGSPGHRGRPWRLPRRL